LVYSTLPGAGACELNTLFILLNKRRLAAIYSTRKLLRDAATKADRAGIGARVRDLITLQARLETLHAAKLLADDELYAAEDAIADSEDVQDGQMSALIALSAKMASDRAFARQLRRKYA
jgi:hypothetical protein